MRPNKLTKTGSPYLLAILSGLSVGASATGIDSVDADAHASGDICFNFEASDGSGDLTAWTLFNTGELDVDWGTNDDGVCRGGSPSPPGNYTGGMNGAACIDSTFAVAGTIEAYLCSPVVDFTTASDVVEFRFNFVNLDASDQESFEVLIGEDVPSIASIATYETVFTQTEIAGGFNCCGVEEQLDLDGSVESGHLCFRYVANNDGYAMLDNVSIGPQTCGPSDVDDDYDGAANDVDNCLLYRNFDQFDADGDGFGNWCDPDITNDCVVNFADLAVLKSAFFPGLYDPVADFNGDGFVSFGDLALLKSRFLQSPAAGPSAIASCPRH